MNQDFTEWVDHYLTTRDTAVANAAYDWFLEQDLEAEALAIKAMNEPVRCGSRFFYVDRVFNSPNYLVSTYDAKKFIDPFSVDKIEPLTSGETSLDGVLQIFGAVAKLSK